MPPALSALVGPLVENGKERRDAAAAQAEFSAYLAELAWDPSTVRVGLGLVARFLFDRRMHGTAECYAALAILEGLGETLGATARAPLLAGGAIDRRAVSALWLELTALPPDRIREGARTLWAASFGGPLPEVRRLDPPEGGDLPR
jgi:hypothetical protein